MQSTTVETPSVYIFCWHLYLCNSKINNWESSHTSVADHPSLLGCDALWLGK